MPNSYCSGGSNIWILKELLSDVLCNLTLQHGVKCKENDDSFNHSLRFSFIRTRLIKHWNETPMPMKPIELNEDDIDFFTSDDKNEKPSGTSNIP